jgi:hypothetical protein
MGIRTPLVVLAGFWALVSMGAASAAEVTQVLSARNLKDRDVHVSLAWQHDQETASVRREYVQTTGTLIINDVTYHQSRDSLRLHAEVALVHDLSFFLGGSLVVADDRNLDYDKRGDCAATPCLETLLRDGFVPAAQDANRVFAGPARNGLEYLALGLRWAAMNQARDHVKPIWVLGLESRFSVAGDQRFDPGNPTGNHAVGLGYHQFIFSSVFSQRFGAFEPYMGGWFMQPMLTSSSVYKNVGTGTYDSPQRRAGGDIGVEGTVWEDPTRHARLALEADGRIEYRLEGLAQSELWEVLSGNPQCATNASLCRSGIDVNASGAAAPNSGVVRSPAYGVFGGDAGFSAHFGRYARLRGLFGMRFAEGHFLTDGGSGNAVYYIPGRRFRIEDAYSWHILVEATATFATF